MLIFFINLLGGEKMDSIERMEIIDRMVDPVNQAGENLKSIKSSKKITAVKEAEEVIEEIEESLQDITTTMKEVQEGRSLTINGLNIDAEKFSENSKTLERITENKKIDEISKMSVKNLSLIALQIRNIINER